MASPTPLERGAFGLRCREKVGEEGEGDKKKTKRKEKELFFEGLQT
jgi:hypothetical protein